MHAKIKMQQTEKDLQFTQEHQFLRLQTIHILKPEKVLMMFQEKLRKK
jgi:hypothetical protein